MTQNFEHKECRACLKGEITEDIPACETCMYNTNRCLVCKHGQTVELQIECKTCLYDKDENSLVYNWEPVQKCQRHQKDIKYSIWLK